MQGQLHLTDLSPWTFFTTIPVADPGFPREGTSTYYLPNFPQKLYKNKEESGASPVFLPKAQISPVVIKKQAITKATNEKFEIFVTRSPLSKSSLKICSFFILHRPDSITSNYR